MSPARAALVETLVREHEPHLRQLARLNADCAANGDDAFAAGVEKALHHLPLDHPDPAGWLGLTIKREAWTITRRRRLVPTDPSTGEAVDLHASAPDPFAAYHDLDEIVRAMECLKPDERTALGDLASGLSYQEIQDRHGWTRTKVNRCLAEGRDRAREEVAV